MLTVGTPEISTTVHDENAIKTTVINVSSSRTNAKASCAEKHTLFPLAQNRMDHQRPEGARLCPV